MSINLELHITMKCNLRCGGCNRLCHIFHDRTEDMSVEQIKKFIDQAKNGGGVKTLKVLGGEPLLHPDFVEIYNLLGEAMINGYIKNIKIETNRTIKTPDGLKDYPIKWQGTKLVNKKHTPATWAPKDFGIEVPPQRICGVIKKCGFSLDKYGYLPCGVSVMIARMFNLTHLYSREFPYGLWGVPELCNYCMIGISDQFNDYFPYELSVNATDHKSYPPVEETGTNQCKYPTPDHPPSYADPTESWEKAINEFNQEEFYKTQEEF